MDRITVTISDETSQQLYASLRIIKDTFVSKSNMFARLVDDIGSNVNLSVSCEEMADILISILFDKPQNYEITEKICGLLDKFQLIEPMKQIIDEHFCNNGPYDQLKTIEHIYFATLGKTIWELGCDKVEKWWRWIKQNNMFGSENKSILDEIISKMDYAKFIEMTRYDDHCQDADAKLTYLWIENRGIMDERIIKNIGFENLMRPTRAWWVQCLSDTNNVIAMKIAIESLLHINKCEYDIYELKCVSTITKNRLLDIVGEGMVLVDNPSLPRMSYFVVDGQLTLHTENPYNIPSVQYTGRMKIRGHTLISCGTICNKYNLARYSTPELSLFEEDSYIINTANLDMIMRIRDDDTIEPDTKVEFEYSLIVEII
jgi:hypothetical protein